MLNTPDRRFGLDSIPWRHHSHVRHRPHDAKILSCVVAETKRAISEAAADADDLDVCVVITGVVPDLLQTAERREISDGIRINDFTLQRQADGQPRHVLLGHTGVNILCGKLSRELLEYSEAKVAGYQNRIPVLPGYFGKSVNEFISHRREHPILPERDGTLLPGDFCSAIEHYVP